MATMVAEASMFWKLDSARGRQLDNIRTFEEIVLAIRKRRMDLGWSQLHLDHVSGIPDGYTAKVELWVTNPSAKNARAAGRQSLQLMLAALGMSLQTRYANNLLDGEITCENMLLRLSDEKKRLSERGKKGGKARMYRMTQEHRRRIARLGAIARKNKHKATVKTLIQAPEQVFMGQAGAGA